MGSIRSNLKTRTLDQQLMLMKHSCFSIAILLIALTTNAQQTTARSFYQKAMNNIKPAHVQWLKQIASKNEDADSAKIANIVANYVRSQNLNGMSIEAMVEITMMLIADDTEKDLKDQMNEIEKNNEQKKKMRDLMDSVKKNERNLDAQAISQLKTISKNGMVDKPIVNTTNRVSTPQTTVVSKQVSQNDIIEAQKGLQTKLDSMNQLSSQQQLRLQLYNDRRQKALQTASNIMRKIAETQDSIIQNLK